MFSQVCEHTSGRDVDEELLGGLGYTELRVLPGLCFFTAAGGDHCPLSQRGVSIHWTGLLDWTTGLTFFALKIIFMLCN